ncbi:hypothetical protein ACFX2C_004381 [Malus domestica]
MCMWLSSIRLGFPRKRIHPTQNNRSRSIFVHGGGGGVGAFKWASSQAALALWNSSSSHSDESSDDNSVSVCTTNAGTNAANRTHFFSELDTSGVVNNVNSLRNEPNLAISFFHRVKGDGFRHNVYTYSALIRILCYWGLDRKLDSLFVDLINCSKDLEFEFSDLMEAIGEGIEVSPSTIRAYDALLKSFVSLNMFDEAIDVLFQTKRRGFVPHIFTSNFLMNRLVEHGKVDMAVAVYKQLKRIGLNPNDYTYAIIIKGLCKKGSLEEAVEVFQEMEEAGVTPSAFAYTAYIEGLCTNHRPDLGYQVLQSCNGENVLIDVYAYNAVIRGFCNEMKFDEAESVFLDMEKRGLVPDSYTYSAMICGYCKSSKLLKALALHNDMESKGIKTNCVIVSLILQCMCKMGMPSEAVDQFREYKSLGIYLDEVSYNIAVDASCKLGKMDQALEFLEEMKCKHMVLDIMHYTTLIKGYCLQGNVVEAVSLLKEMKEKGLKPDITTYNALDLLDYMEAHGFKPDSVTHNMIIENLCIGGKVKEAEGFLNSLEYKNVDTYSAMVSGYCEANHTKEAYELLIRLAKQGTLVKQGVCFKVLSKLCVEGDNDRAILLLEAMLALNVDPKRIIFPKRNVRRVNSSRDASGDKEETFDACTVWSEMKEMEIRPDVICYTVLIDRQCKTDNFQDAIALFDEMMNRGLEPDTVTYTALLAGCCRRGDVDRAVTLANEMSSKGMLPNARILAILQHGILKATKLKWCPGKTIWLAQNDLVLTETGICMHLVLPRPNSSNQEENFVCSRGNRDMHTSSPPRIHWQEPCALEVTWRRRKLCWSVSWKSTVCIGPFLHKLYTANRRMDEVPKQWRNLLL